MYKPEGRQRLQGIVQPQNTNCSFSCGRDQLKMLTVALVGATLKSRDHTSVHRRASICLVYPVPPHVGHGNPMRLITNTWIAALCWLVGFGHCLGEDEALAPDNIAVFRDIQYRSGNKQWRLDLAMRKDPLAKPRPVILVIHGRGWLEGDKSSFAFAKNAVPGNIVDFANLGFVAVTINYRLSGEAPFPAALEDCKCAVRWLRAHAKDYNVDPRNIGAYGNSAGGHLAMLLGMVGKEAGLEGDGPNQDQSSAVQAVASDSGPIDLLDQHKGGQLRQVIEKFLGGPPDAVREALYKRASPTSQIFARTPPILLIYGCADGQVPIQTADRFVVALDQAGLKDVSYYRLAGVDHCPHSLVRIPYLKHVVNDFFVQTLMPRGPADQIKR